MVPLISLALPQYGISGSDTLVCSLGISWIPNRVILNIFKKLTFTSMLSYKVSIKHPLHTFCMSLGFLIGIT